MADPESEDEDDESEIRFIEIKVVIRTSKKKLEDMAHLVINAFEKFLVENEHLMKLVSARIP